MFVIKGEYFFVYFWTGRCAGLNAWIVCGVVRCFHFAAAPHPFNIERGALDPPAA
jgi:hypothetical protein